MWCNDVMYCLRGGACIAALHVMSSNATSCYLWKVRFTVGMWCSICAADIYIQVCIRECMWVCSYEVPQVQLQLNLHHGAPQWNTLFIPNFVFSGTRVQNSVAGEGPSSSWLKPLLTRQLAENSVKRWTKIKMSKGFSFDNVTCTMLMLGIVCRANKRPPCSGCSECCVWGDAVLRRCKWTSPLLASLWVVQVAVRNGR